MIPTPLYLAFRYLHGHMRQYIFVLIVLAIGFAFISVTSSLSDGMDRNVTDAALRHYAGHIFITGRDGNANSMMVIDHPKQVEKAIEKADIPVERIIRRVHEHGGASAFFQGNSFRLKDIFGVDFNAESHLFEGFDYVSGSFNSTWDKNSIILSKPVAEKLRAQVDDRVIIRLENRNGQLDTRTFTVRAITADSSIFGYARAYVHRKALSSLMKLDPAEYSVFGIFVPDMSKAVSYSRSIYNALSENLPTAERIENKSQLTSEIRKDWQGVRYFVFPLPIYISEIANLLTAMEIGSYFLLAMIILVVLAAIIVTYRVVLHDRIREIGTMQAVGFSRMWLFIVLLIEALLVLGIGIAIGTLLSWIITYITSFISFDWIPGFEIFMREGKLTALYTVKTLSNNIAIVIGAVLPVISLLLISVVNTQITKLIKGETK